jgi:FAD/FMN-containing dehydrogenase
MTIETPTAGAPVTGWSPGRRTWVTGPAPAGDVEPAPALAGSLELPLPAESFGEDFGRLVHRQPDCVLRAGSAEDVAAVVAYARRCGVTVAVNGQGGRDGQRESHSLHGQSLVDRGGIAVDAKALATIHRIEDGFAEVDAGVRWSSLVRAAVETGQMPPVVNDFPYLSVGGTLSIGGMGATSHRYGSQADNVEELQVVTGRGDLVTCSRTRDRELFDAVLAGAGQYGLIVRALVRLVPAEATATVLKVMYDDRDAYLRDAVAVMHSGLVDDLNGAAVATEGGGWGYGLIMGMYHTAPAAPPEGDLLALLAPGATVAERQQAPYLDWLFRLDAFWDQLQASGHWAQAKPRFTVFVPADRAAELADAVLGGLAPGDMGAGGVRLSPINTAAITQPMFVLPSRTSPAFELSVGRFPEPGHPDVAGLLAQNRRFYDKAVALGAKRYLYGAIPDMGTADWQRHYGDRWGDVVALKSRFDPDNVLTPGQRIFA